MKRLPLASLFAVTALIATSAWSSGASAATLTGDYQMQGTVASAGPGPPLTSLGPASSFQSDNVMGVSRRVLAFPKDGGLQMAPAGAEPASTPW